MKSFVFASKKKMKVCVVLLLAMMVVGLVEGHCQVPCGIFDDAMRIKQLKEDVGLLSFLLSSSSFLLLSSSRP